MLIGILTWQEASIFIVISFVEELACFLLIHVRFCTIWAPLYKEFEM